MSGKAVGAGVGGKAVGVGEGTGPETQLTTMVSATCPIVFTKIS